MASPYTPTMRVRSTVSIPVDGDERNAATLFGPARRALEASRYTRDVLVKNFTLEQAGLGFDVRGIGVGFGRTYTQEPFGTVRIPRIVAAGSTGAVLSADGLKWSLVATGSYEDAAYSTTANRWALVGVGIKTSTDAVSWTSRTIPAQAVLYGVCSVADGGFVAVGEPVGGQAFVLRSDDGIAWAQQTTTVDEALYAITHAGALTVAVGGSSTAPRLVYSADGGLGWTEAGVPGGVGGALTDVTHNGEVYLAVSNDGKVITSPDGTAWSLSADVQLGHAAKNRISADPLSGAIMATSGGNGHLVASFDNGLSFAPATWLSVNGNPVAASALAHGLDCFLAGTSTGYIARGLSR